LRIEIASCIDALKEKAANQVFGHESDYREEANLFRRC